MIRYRDENVLREQIEQAIARANTPEARAEAEKRRREMEQAEEEAKDRVISSRRRSVWEQRGRRYQNCTLENFETGGVEAKIQVLEELRTYQDGVREMIEAGCNLVLTGPVGTGKDHLLAALFEPAIALGKTLVWTSGARLFARMRDRIEPIGRQESESRVLAEYQRPDVLVISDPMPLAGQLTQYQRAVLYAIVDERYNHCRAIWCSINARGRREADETIGSAIVDRLVDGALSLSCNWPSFRHAGNAKQIKAAAGEASCD